MLMLLILYYSKIVLFENILYIFNLIIRHSKSSSDIGENWTFGQNRNNFKITVVNNYDYNIIEQ